MIFGIVVAVIVTIVLLAAYWCYRMAFYADRSIPQEEYPVPKGEMFAIMEKIHAATVEAPVAIGDVILDNICGTRIVATKEIR